MSNDLYNNRSLQEDMIVCALQRFKLQANSRISLNAVAQGFMQSVEMARQIDHASMSMAWTIYGYIAKGETQYETRDVSQVYKFTVFKTWWDHLKYDLKTRRIMKWLPAKLTWKLKVEYQDINKTATMTVPVTILRVCPHALIDWNNDMVRHVRFMLPTQLKDVKLYGE